MDRKLRALIIDDEKKARNLLRILLEENCPQVVEIEDASALVEGVRKIKSFKPDIVFLDIEMPGHSGLQLLEFISPDEVDFEIIFTTAYSEYAIKAFELNAIDYLLKPLRDEQVEQAVLKAQKQIGQSQIVERLRELKKVFQNQKFQKIGLPVSNGIFFVPFDDIIMMEADRMYAKVFTLSHGELLVSKPLKFLIEALRDVPEFYRPHRSYLINISHIHQYINEDGGYIVMEQDLHVALSKDKKEEFLSIVQSR